MPGIAEQYMPDARILFPEFQQFIYLFLVFDDCVVDFGIVQDELHLLGDRVLVEGHGDTAKTLGGGHSHVQAGTVITDDGQLVAPLESQGSQPAGHRPHFVEYLPPGPGLPDAQIFFAHGDLVAAHAGMIQQQFWKGIQLRFAVCFRSIGG